MLVEIDDRVSNYLSGTVVGRLAPSSNTVNLRTGCVQSFNRHKNVRVGGLAPEGDDRRVFNEDDRVRNLLLDTLLNQLMLELQSGAVGHPANVPEVQRQLLTIAHDIKVGITPTTGKAGGRFVPMAL